MSSSELPHPSVHVHKNGTYSHIYYEINPDGKVVQVKRILKIGRDHDVSKKAIEERRKNWIKFGLNYLNDDPNVQPTRLDTDFKVKLVQHPDELDAPETMVESAQRKLKDTSIKCRFCFGPHWSKECPSKDIIASLQEATASVMSSDSAGASDSVKPSPGGHSISGTSSSGGRYVPPSARAHGGVPGVDDRPGMTMPTRRMDDSFPVRIANLPEEMTDQDLNHLTTTFGNVVRSYLAKHDDGTCKGFAFVNFSSYTAADACVQRLHGYGYANLIITCEHSKPRNPNP